MQPKISLQTFTIRKYLKSPKAIEQGLARVKKLGINAIELAYIKLKPDEIAAVARACRQHSIDVGSSQITYDFLQKNKDWVLDFHLNKLDCQITSVSVLPQKVITGDVYELLQFAEELESLGEYYRERGLKLCFHHHDFEFRRYGERMGLDVLMENTGPQNVGLVLDCYWAQRGGKTPQSLISSYANRVNVIHLRDYSVKRKFFEMTPTDVALGQGNLDINAIVESCCAANVQYMAIEQGTKTPYDNVKISVTHLQKLGFNSLF